MRLWWKACGSVLVLGTAVGAGCGGKVLVDGGGGYGGGGGEGGGPLPGVTTGPTSVTVGPTTSVTVGPTTNVTSSVSTGPTPVCDGTGDCGDGATGCIGCSLDPNGGPCWPLYQECFQVSDDCMTYYDCVVSCEGSDPACYDKCAEVFPDGAQLYSQLVICVYCDACYSDCDGPGIGCP